jgi:hypothetical protein
MSPRLFCCPTALYRQLGGWDERFDQFGGSAIDFFLRCHKDGVELWPLQESMAVDFAGPVPVKRMPTPLVESVGRGPAASDRIAPHDGTPRTGPTTIVDF